ncbi:hypothetical protein BC828DRAFT_407846 [Blastocladiella britannica]|nr:hypothetical protein BC828DRAFT_407846 [Blastocladiella britannica]
MADSSKARFCQHCQNLLNPREHVSPDTGMPFLAYVCRSGCDYAEEATSSVVYRHEVKKRLAAENTRVENLLQDPTLPRQRMQCPSDMCVGRCADDEVVYYQDRSQHKDAGMTLFYVCTHCHAQWGSAPTKRQGGEAA